MIAYRNTAGVITDLRLVPDSYVAQPGETVAAGDALPSATSSLQTPAEALAAAKVAAKLRVTAGCGGQIVSGFTSSALGAAFTYPSDATSQTNLAGSVVASLLPSGQVVGWTTPLMCRDALGVWARRAHTAAQIQQAGLDGKAFISGLLTRLDGLRAQADAAATVVDANKIVW
jgi:hypothetical protein